MDEKKKTGLIKLIASIIICQAAGFIGSLFTTPAIPNWYAALEKPSFTPPGVVFGPVWTALYLMMGISLFLVWKSAGNARRRRTALAVFVLQLILNTLWSILFFGLRSPLAGLLDIAALWVMILLTILLFWRISKTAAWLLVPYLLWVSFATLLNASILALNHS
jgi:tryptophan-rich sensory protein